MRELVINILPYVSDTLWVGPMNKNHVKKELWTPTEDDLYKSETLLYLKEQLDSLKSNKIKYKDHFLNKIKTNEDIQTSI